MPHIQSLEQLHQELQRTKPSPARCRAIGLYDFDDVLAEFYGYCVCRFAKRPFTQAKLAGIARWFPSHCFRQRRRERLCLEDSGRIIRSDRFRGRTRTALNQRGFQ